MAEQLTNLWNRLADGSLCKEHPIQVWGASIALAGGVYLVASSLLHKEAAPSADQAAFDKAGSAGSTAHRVPNKSTAITAAAKTLGTANSDSPLIVCCAAEVSANWLLKLGVGALLHCPMPIFTESGCCCASFCNHLVVQDHAQGYGSQ